MTDTEVPNAPQYDRHLQQLNHLDTHFHRNDALDCPPAHEVVLVHPVVEDEAYDGEQYTKRYDVAEEEREPHGLQDISIALGLVVLGVFHDCIGLLLCEYTVLLLFLDLPELLQQGVGIHQPYKWREQGIEDEYECLVLYESSWLYDISYDYYV